MFKLALVLCLLFVLTYADRDQQWKQFKTNHRKGYKDQTEETRRRNNWEKNLDKITKHNEAFMRGETSYSDGENEFSDLSPEEALKTLAGFIAPKNNTGNYMYHEVPRFGATPASVDYRNSVTSVKNQGSCGSCWAFSATGALEAQVFRKYKKLVSLSEQNFVDCVIGNYGCNGGWMDTAFNYAKNGVDTAASYPYKAMQGPCKFNAATVGARVLSITYIPSGNELALQDAVANKGPVSFAMEITNNFMTYKSGVFYDPTCSAARANHAMLIVGYGTDSVKGPYWLVKNSWGPTWGEGGYVRIAKNRNNMCGVASFASYPTIK